jgi:2-polyprenyl-6-methoxyphenol hydroxylase-like FAD-dependent oxidoreductase
VAGAAGAARYHDKPMLAVAYYSYWSGIPVHDAGWVIRPRRGYGAFPTNDALTMLLAAWPATEFRTVKRDVEGNYLQAVRVAFGDRLDGARREERVVGGGVANQFRRPYGPGWALVGDAGYLKDPLTAQGITDAFHDAQLCAAALDEAFTGARSFDQAMADYQRRRGLRRNRLAGSVLRPGPHRPARRQPGMRHKPHGVPPAPQAGAGEADVRVLDGWLTDRPGPIRSGGAAALVMGCLDMLYRLDATSSPPGESSRTCG